MLDYYKKITAKSDALLNKLLNFRLSKGKESQTRLNERKGEATLPRPDGLLIWLHAASVGETQSTLILIDTLSKEMPQAKFMVTSGTITSAELMAKRLPSTAFHQFYPLDHPAWVEKFLYHWQPNLILWMESELWPNMLMAIQQQNIPAVLVNARLSDKSFKIWNIFSRTAQKLLSTFSLILTQTQNDEMRFKKLRAQKVFTTDNIKYSAAPLPYQESELADLQTVLNNRPTWVYASTHDGEELLACKLHASLVQRHPDLLTIIVPRHPERRDEIKKICNIMKLQTIFRGEEKKLPHDNTNIYVVDTLGELGLFYKLSPIAMIGRSFSNDGGGGHNPIEAAQMGCAVLTGPNVQFQSELFREMFAKNAAHQMNDKTELLNALRTLLEDEKILKESIELALKFASNKTNVIHIVMEQLEPILMSLKNGKFSDAA